MKPPTPFTSALATPLFCFFLVTSLASAAPPLENRLRDPAKPNIIIIAIDDLGYGELGCYGQKKIQTPNIDRLAAEGMRFTQCYAGSSDIAPSRATLLTGLHTAHTHIRDTQDTPLRSSDLTLARHLAAAGYRTGGVGRWDLGPSDSPGAPTAMGFADWVGFTKTAEASIPYPTEVWRGGAQGTRFLTLTENRNNANALYVHDLFTKVAYNFIRTEKYFPLFLYVSFTLPHSPSGTKQIEVPSDAPYSSEDWPQAQKNKAALLTRIDTYVGKLLAQLDNLKLDDLTAIFLTGDNASHDDACADPVPLHSNGPFRGTGHDLSEGDLRAPLIVRWLGHIKPGSVSDELCAFWDLFPTASAMANLKPPPDLDGISLLPALLGETLTNRHEFLYWERRNGDHFQQAVRMDKWKGIRKHPGRPIELYDLDSDPGEQKNLASQRPDIVTLLEPHLSNAREASPQLAPLSPSKTGPATLASNLFPSPAAELPADDRTNGTPVLLFIVVLLAAIAGAIWWKKRP